MSTHDNSRSNDLIDSNVFSKSLMNDSGFWSDFLKDGSFSENDNVKEEIPNEQEKNKYHIPQKKLKCHSLHTSSKQVSKVCRFDPIKCTQTSGNNKSYKYICSHNNDKLPYNVLFSKDSYFYKIKGHIENSLKNKVPVLLIKDILKAKSYSIFDELCCKNLYEIDGLVCKNIICRGTVIGLINKFETLTILVSDGTASVWCKFSEEYGTQQSVTDNSAIIGDFESTKISYKTVTAPSDIERGIVVQALGAFDIYKKVLIVTKLCTESKVIIQRELSFFKYIENCYKKHASWKQDIANIYKP